MEFEKEGRGSKRRFEVRMVGRHTCSSMVRRGCGRSSGGVSSI